MQAWRPPTSWPICTTNARSSPRRTESADLLRASRLGTARLAGSTVAVDDGQLPAVFGDRDTQLHAANILGEAGTVIEWLAPTLRLGPSLRGTLGARAPARQYRSL